MLAGIGLTLCIGVAYIIYFNPYMILNQIKCIASKIVESDSLIKRNAEEIRILNGVVTSLQKQVINLTIMNPVINETNGIMNHIMVQAEKTVLLKMCCYKILTLFIKEDNISLQEIKTHIGPELTNLFFI